MKAIELSRGHGRDIGVLERNEKAKGATSPDFVGEIVIDDVPYYLSMWDENDTRTLAVRRMGGGQ